MLGGEIGDLRSGRGGSDLAEAGGATEASAGVGISERGVVEGPSGAGPGVEASIGAGNFGVPLAFVGDPEAEAWDGWGEGAHLGGGAGGDAGGGIEAGIGEEVAIGFDDIAFGERGGGVIGLGSVESDGGSADRAESALPRGSALGVAKDVGWFAGSAVSARADLVADGVIVGGFVAGDEIESEIDESGLRESEDCGADDGDGVSAEDAASGGLHPDGPRGFVAVWGGGGDGGGGGAWAGDGGGGVAEIGPAVGFGIVGVFVEEIPPGEGGIFEDDGSAAADFEIGPVAGAGFCPIVMIDLDIAEASGGAITGEAVAIDFIGTVHGIEADDHSAVGVGVADVAGVIESAIFDEDIASFAEGIGDLPSIGATAHEDEFGVTEIGGEATIIDDAVIDPRVNDGEVAIGVGFVGDIGEAEAAEHLGFGGGVVVGLDIEDGDGVTGGGADNFEVFESDGGPEGDNALGVSFAGVIHGDDCGIALALDGDGGDEVDGAGVIAGGISPSGGACGEDDGIAWGGLDVVSVFEVVLGAGGAEDGFGEGVGGEG